jgi:signal transduction histidine kinase/ligand-binding sensor domain-containing protein/DNA-binding response OmpR family regulator
MKIEQAIPMKRHANYYVAAICILCYCTLLQAQEIKFEHISVEQGLSSSIVTSVLQDYQGFMWFGTKDGLNKYDGYTFTTYRNMPGDSTSLHNNDVTALYEDPSGNLWISTIGGGLNKYNREEDNFISYLPDPNNPESISSATMEQTAGYQYNGKDILWIGSANGLNKMDIAAQKFKYYPHSDKGHPYTYIETILVDTHGIVWFGCTEEGLYKFDPWTELFINYQHEPGNEHSLSNNTVMSICEDKSGIFWIGTAFGGLNKFDPEKEQFIRYQHDPKNPASLSNNWVHSLYEDREGNLWVGTAMGGLNRFDRENERFIHYQHDPGNPGSISDHTVIGICEDKSGVFWVGTFEGINKFDPGKIQFSEYKQLPGNPNSLSNNYIWSLYQSDSKGKKTLWIGTKIGGFNKLDRSTGTVTHYLYDPDHPKSQSGNIISALLEDRSGILWIGTYGDGLLKFDPEKEQFTRYLNDSSTLSNNIIRTIYEDKSGILWIGTQTSGLNKFNRETGVFSVVGSKMLTMQIYEDHLGELWIATFSGLKKLDRKTEQFTTFWHDPDNPNSISSNQIISIHEDKSGGLWFGTDGGGLNKFNRESGEFIQYTVKDGLPSDVINGILEDKQGNLWLSTNNGLSRFNSESEQFRNYDVHDGLVGNQFFAGACFKDKDGEMFFGGLKGLNSFYPDRLRDNPYIPNVVITAFQIFNQPVTVKHETAGTKNDIYTLPKNISLLNEIELSYKENIFSFEFAALDYRSPQKNRYAYMLEGLEKDWNYTDYTRRYASYTNLDPGDYTFRVKASNNDGLWNDEGIALKVIIIPPWWRTNWAYLVYLLFIIGAIATTWHFQMKRIRLRNELNMKKFEANKLQEVDRMKSHFFANISHEFRTPLTLIVGPVKQMLSGEFAGNFKEQYKMIIRNGERLLQLINQLLDLSKLESGRMKLRASRTDIVPFLKGLVYSFASLAERKKIMMNFKVKEKSLMGYIDCDKVEKIITNLLSNAFKFTPEGGEIVVTLSLRGSDLSEPKPRKEGIAWRQSRSYATNEIATSAGRQTRNDKIMQFTISNTGAGIPQDQLQRVFDRFYQVDDGYQKDSEGSGIGLALTKELVEVCHGEIQVSSTPTKETVFTMTLPVSKESFKEEEIVQKMETEDRRPETVIQKPVSSIQYPETSIQHPVSRIKKQVSSILIVEDNRDVTRYISGFLQKDYRIISAEEGQAGWQKTLKNYPDLIISDVMMPVMDGFALCKKVKSDQRTSHIPVILLTAKADMESKIDGLEFGADAYVTKPFEARELQVRVKNLIMQRKKLRETFSRMIDVEPNEIAASSLDEQFIKHLLAVFEEHVAESDFSTEDFAREVGMSRMNLHRKLQALTNQSTHAFLRSMRLKRAAQLLQKSAGTVTEIAYAVGFNNLSHFTKIFRQQFGQPPSDFANKNQ